MRFVFILFGKKLSQMRQSSIFGWGRIYLYLYLYPYPLCICQISDVLSYCVPLNFLPAKKKKTKRKHIFRCLFLGHGVCSNQHTHTQKKVSRLF